ncbi:hypothetical protein V6N11_030621 [Hibiscus sabdariffa]|uniref:Uncharacterized protein n=1 Tax=Hibiscus sabdariffa TaxID=183260 RepID=A0ABR1ZNP5_9ROSI
MLVDNSRRRKRSDGGVDARSVMESSRPTRQGMESRKGDPVTPHVVALKEFIPSAAYLASNPGDHTTVAIMKSLLHGKGNTGVQIGKSHGVVSRSFKENLRHGIKGSKWDRQVSNELDFLGHDLAEDASTSAMVSGISARTISYSMELSSDEDVMEVSYGVANDAEDPESAQ